MIDFDFSKFNVDGFKKEIEKHVRQVTEQIAVKTYNYILLNDYPLWSGSYISSWNISVGSPDYSYNAPPDWVGGASKQIYDTPSLVYGLQNIGGYQPVYITNAVPHAYKIENVGTKTSNFQPWKIAQHAVNNTISTYQYF